MALRGRTEATDRAKPIGQQVIPMQEYEISTRSGRRIRLAHSRAAATIGSFASAEPPWLS